jgi:hypothetical protein
MFIHRPVQEENGYLCPFSSFFIFGSRNKDKKLSPAKSGGAVLRITILRAFSLQKVIPRQGRKGSVGRHSEQPSNAWKQVA